MDVFDLVATLSLDTSNYDNGLAEAENKAGSFGSALKSGLGTAAAAGTAAVGALAAGVGAVTSSFIKSSGETASYGDDIDKMSQKLGLSAEAYQEWDAILQHSGTSVSALRPAMKTLQTQAEKNSDAFKTLGISESQLASMSREELFSATITGLQNVSDESERAILAQDLLGRGAMEMGALLNTSAEDTEAMRKRVHELGGVMSDEAVKAAAAYQDSLQDMTTAMDGMKRNLISTFLPSITTVMNGITDIFSGDEESGIGLITEGVDGVITGITEKLPRVIEVGGRIIEAIIQAITDNLPKLIQGATSVVMTLVNGIVGNLPSILQAGVQAILELARGISDALPELIPTMVDAILTMVDTLIDNLPLLIDAALQLMLGLAEGLINAIPVIIERIPEIITSIFNALVEAAPRIAEAGVKLLGSLVTRLPDILSAIMKGIQSILSNIATAFTNFIPTMIDIGGNLLKGLWDGIAGWADNLKNGVMNIGNMIADGFMNFFGISSPSKLFKRYGGFLMEGLAEGLQDNIGMVEDEVDNLNEALDDIGYADDYSDSDVIMTTTSTTDTGGSGRQNSTEALLSDILYALQNMGIMLDGTTLVGRTATRMNQELGNISYYNEREVWA